MLCSVHANFQTWETGLHQLQMFEESSVTQNSNSFFLNIQEE